MELQNLTTTDLLIAFFSGVGATVFGFVLTMLWEWRKSIKQERAIIDALKQELQTNKETLESNLAYINQELGIIDQGKSLVIPLNLLNGDFSDLLFISIPKKLKKDTNILMEIRKISRLSKENNETIKSRETYRVNNGAMSNYNSRMKIYGQILQTQTNQLVLITETILTKI
ncbi:MAG: hypothetical protein US71_C0001G0095 [Parcubacteria group bacterium GW2011_GWD2_38_12]|uniref:Uncharacterized protein n=1 Tax=Candidatus Azambacteria bacterium RIFCSPLOWO2_01_FULL_37_9 TaxID=1797297 RepID=A0A1F5C5T3_9BACT|nr:MAG: hypothetical protein US06_C0002G0007 [Parcubacteria group bacterium GW2011_GWC2_36_17]KKQ42374.1 MAG: hypothetical protein US61_C0027G0003 [Parcubacteria group bacterium GW2011_GWE2_37_8]KKQ52892.1 MAG: hypothetical protein US71_C0001G0095 [Parcubacteria group bacterium GW2011_GWD2_38_12]KKQ59095.1 MAG: hypothetical protein US79_C0001G0094 [Parcubacteria group bacterium GW2011_GWC1_38_17]KKQ59710.1 MAG: hypothetical protein US78_C0001G0070 [Parcubacteria group bacterium GW2011_GWD1_38_1